MLQRRRRKFLLLAPLGVLLLGSTGCQQQGGAMQFLQALFQGLATSGSGGLQNPPMRPTNFQSVPSSGPYGQSPNPGYTQPSSTSTSRPGTLAATNTGTGTNPGSVLGMPGSSSGSGGLPTGSDPGVQKPAQGSPYKVGKASWYGDKEHGGPTSTGETFDRNAMTAAMYGTKKAFMVRVRRVSTGKEITVKVNDAGPFAVDGRGKAIFPLEPHPTRVIDLSQAAFAKLGDLDEGVFDVEVYKL